jgi:phytanoyl-CoA hydroxylase
MLTQNQLATYRRDGFLVLPGFVSTEACDRLRARAEQMVHEFDPAGVASIFPTHEQNRIADDYFLESSDKIRFFFEEDAFVEGQLARDKEHSINKIGHALHDLDPTFSEFCRTGALQQLVTDVGLLDPLLLQSMYIFKQPHIGGEVSCHQDSTFLYTDPPQIIGFWFALEDAKLENGCLWAIPGGHELGLKSRWVRTDEGMKFEFYDTTPWFEEELVPLEVSKGTLILLDGLLPHKSLANWSKRSRHAYTLHVISAQAHYSASNWLQRPENMPLRGF